MLHLPAAGGRVQQMQLRTGVAYDTELLARSTGDSGRVVTLDLT